MNDTFSNQEQFHQLFQPSPWAYWIHQPSLPIRRVIRSPCQVHLNPQFYLPPNWFSDYTQFNIGTHCLHQLVNNSSTLSVSKKMFHLTWSFPSPIALIRIRVNMCKTNKQIIYTCSLRRFPYKAIRKIWILLVQVCI